jgi:hypothetical protein
LTAASGIASGVGNLIGSQRQADQAAEEQRRLRRRIAEIRANRGLSGAERARMEAEAGREAATIERSLGAERAEGLAAQAALGGAVSGRDIFLREQAAQQARTGARIEAGRDIQAAEAMRRAEQQAEIASLRGLRSAAEQREAEFKAQRARAVGEIVTGGLSGGALLAGKAVEAEKVEGQREFEIKKILAELGELDDEAVRAAAGGTSNPYGSRTGPR